MSRAQILDLLMLKYTREEREEMTCKSYAFPILQGVHSIFAFQVTNLSYTISFIDIQGLTAIKNHHGNKSKFSNSKCQVIFFNIIIFQPHRLNIIK